MAGIYIHIPFCKKACIYCDFHFSTTATYQKEMIAAINTEIFLRKDELDQEIIKTIYFGGGTPSILSTEEIKSILDRIYSNFEVIKDPEITLEANPDDLDLEKLKALKKAGINRLSIGIQSFFSEHLEWMNRAHTSKEGLQCIKDAQSIGFDNITIDLIYGIPTMTDEQWFKNIAQAITMNIPHISAYNLTVEKKTALDFQIKKGISQPLDDEQGEHNFEVLKTLLKAKGYIHYEVSNFGKEGYISKHNTSYWQSENYLGFGPSAHSFNGENRSWNVSNNKKYLNNIQNKELPLTIEELSNADKANEHLMLGLRNIWGCNWEYLENCLSSFQLSQLKAEMVTYIMDGQILNFPSGFKISDSGLLFADGIASELFVE